MLDRQRGADFILGADAVKRRLGKGSIDQHERNLPLPEFPEQPGIAPLLGRGDDQPVHLPGQQVFDRGAFDLRIGVGVRQNDAVPGIRQVGFDGAGHIGKKTVRQRRHHQADDPRLGERQPAGKLAGLVPELGGGGQNLALGFGSIGDFFGAPMRTARIREAVDLLTPAKLATSSSVGTAFATVTPSAYS